MSATRSLTVRPACRYRKVGRGWRLTYPSVTLDGEAFYVTVEVWPGLRVVDLQASNCLTPGTTGDAALDQHMCERAQDDIAQAQLGRAMALEDRRWRR